MNKLIIIISFLLILTSNSALCQNQNKRWSLGEKEAKEILKESLKDSTLHNVIGFKELLIEKDIAIEFAELILFGIYGKDNIQKQKPYDVYKIETYWLINGTLPKDMHGGTFLIIIDSRDYRIIRLTHGK